MILKRNTSNKSKRVMYKGTIIILKPNTQLLSDGRVEVLPNKKEKETPKPIEKVIKKRNYTKKDKTVELNEDTNKEGE